MYAQVFVLLLAGAAAAAWPQDPAAEAGAIRQHPYPHLQERRDERERMVDTLLRYRGTDLSVTDARVIQAMRHVPRHRFVPLPEQSHAYRDSPVPIGYGQTISQPYIVALMTQLADVGPAMKVLEVGTGSGYQAALLYELTDQVYSLEIIAPLAARTAGLFRELGLDAIHAREGDGYYGWTPAPDAPFDRILVTAAARHIPPPLLRQLAPGGRMIIPVGSRWGVQQLMVISKDAAGQTRTRSVLPVRFVPLTGDHRGQ